MQLFLPKFEGTLLLPRIPDGFFERVARRVHEGLLIRGSRNRANYTVQRADRYDVRFAAADVSTAINIGLNEVRVYCVDGQRIGYSVTFWKWTLYVVILCAVIGVLLAAAFFCGRRCAVRRRNGDKRENTCSGECCRFGGSLGRGSSPRCTNGPPPVAWKTFFAMSSPK